MFVYCCDKLSKFLFSLIFWRLRKIIILKNQTQREYSVLYLVTQREYSVLYLVTQREYSVLYLVTSYMQYLICNKSDAHEVMKWWIKSYNIIETKLVNSRLLGFDLCENEQILLNYQRLRLNVTNGLISKIKHYGIAYQKGEFTKSNIIFNDWLQTCKQLSLFDTHSKFVLLPQIHSYIRHSLLSLVFIKWVLMIFSCGKLDFPTVCSENFLFSPQTISFSSLMLINYRESYGNVMHKNNSWNKTFFMNILNKIFIF
jgi:hypothetical protein